MRVLWAVALLLVPTASAEIDWSGPTEAQAGAPVFAAYTIEDGASLEGHVNVRLEVWLDDHLLLETDSIHEHDGAFPTVVTPPAPGTLRLVATTDSDTATREIQVSQAPQGNLSAAAVSRDATKFVPTGNSSFLALFDAARGDGNLVLSAWTRDAVQLQPYEDPVAPRALFVPDGDEVFGAQWVTADGPPDFGSLLLDPGSPRFDGTGCPSYVVLDPNSAAMATPAWQAETNIRIMVLNAPGPVTYTLTGPQPTGPSLPPDVQFEVTAADPLAQLTFRPGRIGTHTLFVQGDGFDCGVRFEVLPAADGEQGTVEADLQVNGSTLDAAFRAVGADGAVLGHYEFDTRVVRLDDDAPGRLAWAGKMHGHGGDVRFALHNLEPGTYEVTTYPSPQDAATPGVDAPSPEGFRYLVDVEAADGQAPWLGADAVEESPDKSTPLPLAVVALALLFVMRRRR